MTEADGTMAYIAKHECGGMLAATVDRAERRKETGYLLRSWVSWPDCVVERLPVETVRAMAFCDHFPEKPLRAKKGGK